MSSCFVMISYHFSHLKIGYRPAKPTTYCMYMWEGHPLPCEGRLPATEHSGGAVMPCPDDLAGVGCCVVHVNSSCLLITWILPTHCQQLSMQ